MGTVTDSAHPRLIARKKGDPSISNVKGLKVALVQLAVGADKTRNIEKAVKEIYLAKEKGANLVALPECFNSPYGTKYFNEYAEEIPNGPTSLALSQVARNANLFVVGGTLPERHDGKLYNTCTVWDNAGNLVTKHRKIHLFDIDIPGQITFKESEVLSAGDSLTTFCCRGVKIGIGICYDIRFEEMARIYANEGCSMIMYPGAFNMTTGPKHWELLGRARAVDQQLYVALISPARDMQASYIAWGHTTMCNPWGEVMGKLDEKEGILLADVDVGVAEEVRTQIPVSRQRRTDVYETILKHKLS